VAIFIPPPPFPFLFLFSGTNKIKWEMNGDMGINGHERYGAIFCSLGLNILFSGTNKISPLKQKIAPKN